MAEQDYVEGPPPQWTPPSASPKARHFWDMGPIQRGIKLITADPVKDRKFIEDLVLIGFESFSPLEMHQAISAGRDIIPDVIKKGALHYRLVAPWAGLLIRKYWSVIYYYLVGYAGDPDSGPPGILRRMRVKDPLIAREFETPEGWAWLTWSCYDLIGFLKMYGSPRDNSPIPVPPMQSPLHKLQLTGRGRS